MTVLPKAICAKTPNIRVALSFNDSKVLLGKKYNKLNCFLLGIPIITGMQFLTEFPVKIHLVLYMFSLSIIPLHLL